MSSKTSVLFADVFLNLLELLDFDLENILVTLLSEAATNGTLSVLHSLSGLLVFLRIFIVLIETVLINNGLFKVFTFFVSKSLEFIIGSFIVSTALFIVAYIGRLLLESYLLL